MEFLDTYVTMKDGVQIDAVDGCWFEAETVDDALKMAVAHHAECLNAENIKINGDEITYTIDGEEYTDEVYIYFGEEMLKI